MFCAVSINEGLEGEVGSPQAWEMSGFLAELPLQYWGTGIQLESHNATVVSCRRGVLLPSVHALLCQRLSGLKEEGEALAPPDSGPLFCIQKSPWGLGSLQAHSVFPTTVHFFLKDNSAHLDLPHK
jgi:hypothetical protein